MNFWEAYIPEISKNRVAYKKWSDLTSGHFFLFQISDQEISYRDQIRIARRHNDEIKESGRPIIYLSSPYYLLDNGTHIPLFIAPARSEIDRVSKLIHWTAEEQSFQINPIIFSEKEIVLSYNDVGQWLEWNQEILPYAYLKSSPALYFHTSANQYIELDLQEIKATNQTSGAMNELCMEDSKLWVMNEESSLDFFDFGHYLPLDYSQAKVLKASDTNSIVVSGPPGTGKSQTILNLALRNAEKGKKILILSQKRSALEVLALRLKELDLDHLSSYLASESDPREFFRDIERELNRLRSCSLSESPDETLIFIARYKHAIRTLRDYYEASNKRMQTVHSSTSDIQKNHRWIEPNKALDNLKDPREALLKTHKLLGKNDIRGIEHLPLSIWNDFLLAKPLLDQLNREGFHLWMKKTNIKKQLLNLKTKRSKLKEKSLVQDHPPLDLNAYEHNSLKAYLKEPTWYRKLWNRQGTRLYRYCEKRIADWSAMSVKDQIRFLDTSQKNKSIQNELELIEVKIGEIENKMCWTSSDVTIYQYLEAKIDTKIPFYIFYFDHFISSKNHTFQNAVLEVLESTRVLQSFGYQWKNIEIFDFISKYGEQDHPLVEDSIEPVLRNYTKRDIVRLAQFVRQNYGRYCEECRIGYRRSYNQSSIEILKKVQSRDAKKNVNILSIKQGLKYLDRGWSGKRKNPGIRAFIEELGDAYLFLKPITIMTNDQVSKFLPLKGMYDLVIMDESSQMDLAYAIPALVRAKRTIVFGDQKQLAPTRFFRNTNQIVHYENILELAQEKLTRISLNYHYRSMSSNLIAYSNQYFYDYQLKTSTKLDREALEYHYIPNAMYILRRNSIEAKAVIDYILNNWRNWLSDTVGIITFSLQQKEEIEDYLDQAMKSNPDFLYWFQSQANRSEYFFIKSIEQVQGDERDIILISTGYAPNQEGKLYQYFGPVLQAKGANRLNVLMSRSKQKITLFTSLKSNQLRLTNSSTLGLRLFQKMLLFFEDNHRIEAPLRSTHQNYWEYFLSPFRK